MQKKKPFPWWLLIFGFLFVRWGIQLYRHPERLPGAMVGLVVIALLVLAALYALKIWMQNKLQKLSNADFVPIEFAQFAGAAPSIVPNLPLPDPSSTSRDAPKLPFDFEAIDEWSKQFHQMGFTWLLDYSLDEESRKVAPGQVVSRLMIEPERRIYACVRQTVMNGQALPVRPSLYAFLNDGGEIISIAANAQDANLALHRPQDIYDFLPDATPQQLLERHLERRSQAQQFLGKSIRSETDSEFFLNYERTGAIRLLEAYRKTNIFRLVKYLLTMNSTRTVLGELNGHVTQ